LGITNAAYKSAAGIIMYGEAMMVLVTFQRGKKIIKNQKGMTNKLESEKTRFMRSL
jgi:hypothetical protein